MLLVLLILEIALISEIGYSLWSSVYLKNCNNFFLHNIQLRIFLTPHVMARAYRCFLNNVLVVLLMLEITLISEIGYSLWSSVYLKNYNNFFLHNI